MDYKPLLCYIIYIFVSLKWHEAAIWCAIQEVILDVRIRGCHFHWTQAIWHKFQDFGLAVAYMEDAKTHIFIQHFFCLTFLLAKQIQTVVATILAFDALTFSISHSLQQLLDYISNTWVHITIWPAAGWSVFKCSIRTNIDCEGWHRWLNSKLHWYNILQAIVNLLQ